nr:hypothetical protein [Pectobacterium versatile]
MTEAQQRLFILSKLSNPWWRLNNLYKIENEKGQLVTFRMRPAQRRLFKHMHYRNIILKARQLGFSTAIDIYLLDQALFNKNIKCGIIAQDKNAAGEIFRTKISIPFDNLPGWLRSSFKITERRSGANGGYILFSHGSSIQVATSFRSGTVQRLHISEHGKICAKYPAKAKEVRTGTLNAVHDGCIVFDESTAEGVGGDFHTMSTRALELAQSGVDLTMQDYKFHFYPWFDDPKYVAPVPAGGLRLSKYHQEYFAAVEAAKRVMLQVIYYRTYQRVPVLELSNGRVIQFDKNNVMHGLLQAKRIIKDADATNMTDRQLADEVERPDGVITLNPQRHNKTTAADAINIQQDFQVAQQQFQVMQESMKLIQDGMGVYSAFLGQDSSAASGVAISNLVEQGATTLAEINDNYQFACQQVGQLLLSYLLEDLTRRRNYSVVVNRDDPRRRKSVTINEESEGDGGMTNDVSRLRAHIALAPIQQTPAYKSQLAERMSQVITGLPPQVQATVLDMWVELLDVPKKAEFIERIRSALGTPKAPDEMTPEEQHAAQQQQQLQAQQQDLAMREIAGKVAKLEAEAQRITAAAQREQTLTNSQRFDDARTQAETGRILQDMENTTREMEALSDDIRQRPSGSKAVVARNLPQTEHENL